MAKLPKSPSFQNLPTLKELATRRRQTVTSILEEWGIKDENALLARLKQEGLAVVEDLSQFFVKQQSTSTTKNVKVDIEEKKKITKVQDSVSTSKEMQDKESKKPTKTKVNLDVEVVKSEVGTTVQHVGMVSEQVEGDSSKT